VFDLRYDPADHDRSTPKSEEKGPMGWVSFFAPSYGLVCLGLLKLILHVHIELNMLSSFAFAFGIWTPFLVSARPSRLRLECFSPIETPKARIGKLPRAGMDMPISGNNQPLESVVSC